MSNIGEFTISSHYAVPIAMTRLEQSADLNQQLQALILEREGMGETYRNKQQNSLRQSQLFESEFNLFSWPEPCVQQLKQYCLTQLLALIARLNGYSADDMQHISVFNDCWFHVTRKHGYFTSHNHPNASWSGIYCVNPGKDAPDAAESGVVRFMDRNAESRMYLDPGNARMGGQYGLGTVNIKLVEGQLVFFPSYLLHEVSPFFGDDERITIAMNCWFRDSRVNYPGLS